MERRSFIKKSCGLCVTLTGLGVLSTLLESCSSIKVLNAKVNGGELRVLKSELASGKPVIVSADGAEANIALIKNGDEILALEMVCTHAENPLTFDGNNFHCNLHGSNFSKTGQVLNGPAAREMKRYKVREEDQVYVLIVSN